METEITISRELAEDIIFTCTKKSTYYMGMVDKYITPEIAETDMELKEILSKLTNDKIEWLFFKIEKLL